MPVIISEFVKILNIDGGEEDGKVIATEIIALEKQDGSVVYGKLKNILKIETLISCDNPACINSSVDENFKTKSKEIFFTDNGSTDPDFLATMAGIVIASDYQGNKKAFCSEECASDFLKRQVRAAKVIEFPAGKGKKSELS